MKSREIHANMKFRLLMERDRRPKAEILDYFKLVYQSCFGLAHIIESKSGFLQYLQEEMKTVRASRNVSLLEPITIFEPIARVNLSRFQFEGLCIEKLTDICLKTAADFKKATKDDFLNCADLLVSILCESPFDFQAEDVHSQIDAYDFESLPPFHHSPVYREHYNPHYRLVIPELFDERF